MASLGRIGLDALNVGERDLGLGKARLEALATAASFPMLSANLVDAASRKLVLKPFVVLEKAGLKVAVIGLLSATKAAPYKDALAAGGLDVFPAADAMAAVAKELEATQVDAWIVLSQLTAPEEEALATAWPRIRAFVGSEAMAVSPEPTPVGGAWRFGAGQKGKQIHVFSVDFQAPGGAGTAWTLGDPKGLAEQKKASASARIRQNEAQLERLAPPAPPAPTGQPEEGSAPPVANPPAPNPRITEVRRKQLEAQLAQARAELQMAEQALKDAEAAGDAPGNTVKLRVFKMGKDLADDAAEADAVKAFRLKWPAPAGH